MKKTTQESRPDALPKRRGAAPKVGACFALAAFAVAMIAGLESGLPMLTVLARGVLVLLVCYPVGIVIGLIIDRIIADHYQTDLAITDALRTEDETAARTAAHTESNDDDVDRRDEGDDDDAVAA